MSYPLWGSNLAYNLGGSNILGRLKMATVESAIDTVDAAGIADADEYNLPVKRGSKHDFSLMDLNGSGIPDTNLDMSLFSIGGSDLLGTVQDGSISGTVRAKDVAGIAMLDKIPAFRRRATEISVNRMVFSTSLVGAMASGAASSMSVLVSITYGVTTFTMQMVMTAGKITASEEETTMENITLKGQGGASSPSDSSLLGVFFNTAQIAVSLTTAATGGEVFSTNEGGGVLALMTRLNVQFNNSSLTKLDGTIEIQGPWTYSAT